MRKLGFICFEEVYEVDTDGRSRFSDIIAFDPKSTKAFIVDPTVKYETSVGDQDQNVRQEKRFIYENFIPFYDEKYASVFGKRSWYVRGTFGQSVLDFFNEVNIDTSELKELSELILSKTIHIINNHIYN